MLSKLHYYIIIFFLFIVFQCFSQQGIENLIVNEILISGNKITREKIILRELTFHKEDTILKTEIGDIFLINEENLLNTSLFNYVSIDTIFIKPRFINIAIRIEERWYIWAYPILEHADRNLSNFIKEKDWNRINYGGFLYCQNFRGRNELLKIKVRYGYKEQFAIAYDIPYFDKHQKIGLSFLISHNRQKEIAFNTVANKLAYYKDNNDFVFTSNNASIEYVYRNKLYFRHYLSANYSNSNIIDTIIDLNTNFFDNSINNQEYISLNYTFIYDKRNLIYYPTKGYYTGFNISKNGLGIFNNKQIDYTEVKAEFRKYFSLNKRLFYAFKIKGSKTIGENNSYYLYNALGYSEILRGFEYSVIDGQDYAVFNHSIKWNVLPQKVVNIKAIPFSKLNKIHYSLYTGLFFDSGYVRDTKFILENNFMANQYLYSGGIGFDLVTYYDRVFRLEFSINKFGETGIFIHFTAAI